MSGTPPYTYIQVSNGILLLADALIYVYDAETNGVGVIEGVSFFEEGCIIGRGSGDGVEQFPINAYDINYPYCRVGVEYRMDDPTSDPLIAQIVSVAPIALIRITLGGCDASDIVFLKISRMPTTMRRCAVALYPGNKKNEYVVVVDSTLVVLPCRMQFEALNRNGVTKTFQIAVRDRRDGVPSGAVL